MQSGSGDAVEPPHGAAAQWGEKNAACHGTK